MVPINEAKAGITSVANKLVNGLEQYLYCLTLFLLLGATHC